MRIISLKIPLLLLAVLVLSFVHGFPQSNDEVDNGELEAKDEVASDASGSSIDESAHLSQEEKDKKLINAAKTLFKIVGTLVGFAGGPAGGTISIGVALVSYLIGEFKKENTNLWKKLETKVELKIGEKLSEYHFQLLNAQVFRVLESRIENPEEFGANDLRAILDKRHLVFPQNFPVLGWSYNLPLAILYWMPFMISGYQQMIKKGDQPVCALANELARTRANVITAMKEMMRKRYKLVHATKYSSQRSDCKKKKRKQATKRFGRLGFSDEKVCVSIDRLLTFDDGLEGKSFTIRKRFQGWVGDSWDDKINKIRDDTVEFLWKEVVEKVNKFFDPSICLEGLGCNCPQKIDKREIKFSYPKSCFGTDNDGTCMHPCGPFGYSYDWCYIYRSPDVYSTCTRPDLEECMPVTTPPIKFPNVLPSKKAKDQ